MKSSPALLPLVLVLLLVGHVRGFRIIREAEEGSGDIPLDPAEVELSEQSVNEINDAVDAVVEKIKDISNNEILEEVKGESVIVDEDGIEAVPGDLVKESTNSVGPNEEELPSTDEDSDKGHDETIPEITEVLIRDTPNMLANVDKQVDVEIINNANVNDNDIPSLDSSEVTDMELNQQENEETIAIEETWEKISDNIVESGEEGESFEEQKCHKCLRTVWQANHRDYCGECERRNIVELDRQKEQHLERCSKCDREKFRSRHQLFCQDSCVEDVEDVMEDEMNTNIEKSSPGDEYDEMSGQENLTDSKKDRRRRKKNDKDKKNKKKNRNRKANNKTKDVKKEKKEVKKEKKQKVTKKKVPNTPKPKQKKTEDKKKKPKEKVKTKHTQKTKKKENKPKPKPTKVKNKVEVKPLIPEELEPTIIETSNASPQTEAPGAFVSLLQFLIAQSTPGLTTG